MTKAQELRQQAEKLLSKAKELEAELDKGFEFPRAGYYVGSDGEIRIMSISTEYYKRGELFVEKSDAETKKPTEEYLNLLIHLSREYDNGWGLKGGGIDWSDKTQKKYYLYFDNKYNEWCWNHSIYLKFLLVDFSRKIPEVLEEITRRYPAGVRYE